LEGKIRGGNSDRWVLGVSLRTLQEWEQGRRNPSGAAKSLITIAIKNPEMLKELLAA